MSFPGLAIPCATLPDESMPRVLIVEDDERNAALFQLALEMSGIPWQRASSVEEARQHLAAGLPDVILLDLRLPDGPGHILAREVREAAGGSQVLILAVSASVQDADRREAHASGADGFIDKPISPRDLVARVLHGAATRRRPSEGP